MEAIAHRLHFLEMLGHEFYKTFMIQIAGRGNDHVAGRKSLAIEIKDRTAVKSFNCVAGAQDRSAKRMIFPEVLGENLVDEVVGIVFVARTGLQPNPDGD